MRDTCGYPTSTSTSAVARGYDWGGAQRIWLIWNYDEIKNVYKHILEHVNNACCNSEHMDSKQGDKQVKAKG